MKTIRLLLTHLCFLLLLLSALSITIQGAGDEVPLHKDIILEQLDLLVDGSVNPQTINLTAFPAGSWLTVLVLNIHFETNALDYDLWGAGPALVAGSALLVDGVSALGENLTTNHGFGHVSGDLTIYTDEKNPKDRHFVSRLALFEIAPPWGFQWTSNTSLQFLIQDDITAGANAIDAFEVVVEGFSIPVADKVVSDDPRLDLIGWLQNQYAFFIGILVVGLAVIIFLKVILPMLRM